MICLLVVMMQDVAALNGAQPTPQMPLTSASPQSGQSAHTAGPLLTVQDQGSDDRGACMLLSDLRHSQCPLSAAC